MKKLIFFDFDGTLTTSNSWYLFNTAFGMTPEEDSSLFDRYLKNQFNYEEWTRQIIAILKDRNLCTESKVKEFSESISLRDGAFDLIQACKDAGYKTIILSGGLKQIVEPFANQLGIDEVYSTNEIVFDTDGAFVSIHDQSDEMHAKVKAFIDVCAKYEILEDEAIMVGDGGNDLEIFKRTKKAIQIGNYEPLKEFAWKQVQNLSEIKELI
jgi:phosphoserine phosphatase